MIKLTNENSRIRRPRNGAARRDRAGRIAAARPSGVLTARELRAEVLARLG